MQTDGGKFETLAEDLNIKISFQFRHGDIRLAGVSKHWFEGIVTRLAAVSFPSHLDIIGVDYRLYGDTHDDVLAQNFVSLFFWKLFFAENERNRRIFNSYLV